jgi:hypothetical protein
LGRRGVIWESVAYSLVASSVAVFLAAMAYLRRSEDLLVACALFAISSVYLWLEVFQQTHPPNGQGSGNRRRFVFVFLPLAALALLGSLLVDCSYDGHSKVGEEAHEALIARDADKLLSLVSPDEVKGNGLTAENLRRFIDNYVFRGSDTVVVERIYPAGPDFPAAVSYWYRDYRLKDGDVKHIGLHATKVGYIINIVPLLLDCGRKQRDISLADAIDRDAEILSATGIEGVYYDSKFETWHEYAATIRAKSK